MVSKVKVDAIESTTGSGTIALNNQFSGMSVASLPTLTTTEIPTLTSSHMPAGSVIQVVETYSTSGGTSTSTSWADAGMSVSITPSSTSSKILLIASLAMNVQTTANTDPDGGVRLLRGSTVIHAGGDRTPGLSAAQSNGWTRNGQQMCYTKLDSPSTTSATTYKVQFKILDAGDQLYLNVYGSSTMTLMEIKG